LLILKPITESSCKNVPDGFPQKNFMKPFIFFLDVKSQATLKKYLFLLIFFLTEQFFLNKIRQIFINPYLKLSTGPAIMIWP
jgi:hypothetical protein